MDGAKDRADRTAVSPQAEPYHYHCWIGKDAQGTEFESGYSTWFHFSVAGHRKGTPLTFTLRNMNRQGALYANGFKPVVKAEPTKPVWAPVNGTAEFSVGRIVRSSL